MIIYLSSFFQSHGAHRDLHSFPTRRSSDLGDAPHCERVLREIAATCPLPACPGGPDRHAGRDRKSTRLNSSHRTISYAVFCLKKKKKKIDIIQNRIANNDL